MYRSGGPAAERRPLPALGVVDGDVVERYVVDVNYLATDEEEPSVRRDFERVHAAVNGADVAPCGAQLPLLTLTSG